VWRSCEWQRGAPLRSKRLGRVFVSGNYPIAASRDRVPAVSRAFRILLSIGLLLALAPREANAETFTRRSFVLPSGSVELTGMPARPVVLGLDISDDGDFEPFHAPLHLYFGVATDLTLGITHEVGPFYPNGGPCFNCDRVYNDVGLSILFNLVRSRNFDLELSFAAPQFTQFRPDLFVAVRGGVLGRANLGDTVALVFDPSLQIGLSNRSEGNGDYLWLPFWFYFQVTDSVAPFVGSGLGGGVEGFFSHMEIPLEGGVIVEVSQNVDLGGVFQFHNLFGDGGSFAWRQLGLLGRFRFN
jgi:hypothetical protein